MACLANNKLVGILLGIGQNVWITNLLLYDAYGINNTVILS